MHGHHSPTATVGVGRRIRPLGWLQRRVVRVLRAVRQIAAPRHPPPPDARPVVTYVGNNRVLVGTYVGEQRIAYLVEADDRLLSPWFIVTGRYEIALTDFFLRHLRPDSHCLDIGSNFGFFACLMARYCPDGRVIGVEADRRVADLARDNLFINGLHATAAIVHAAAGDRREPMTLYRRTSRSGNTSIVDVGVAMTEALGEPAVEAFTVDGVRVDDLAERFDGRVDFIKIDVEGAEPLVLEGARRTIARNPGIVVVMEWSPGQFTAAGFDTAGFAREIAALGLRCSVLDRGEERAIDAAELATLPYQAGVVLRRG